MSPARGSDPWWASVQGRGHRKPAARGRGARRAFGTTWWGQAWVDALEHRAALDPNRLPRGRGYARSGSVSDLVISAGEVRAQVQGSRGKPYSVVVRVRAFDRAEWARVLDAVAAQIGRTAALLDGELPPELVDDVRAAGLDLLPGPGEVQPRCSCPDWADPCKHSAAVCYLVADTLDADPFALLRLRGRDRDAVLAGLRALRSTNSPGGPVASRRNPATGVVARDAYDRAVGDLPAVPLPPQRPGRPAVLAMEPPADAGVRADALAALAADAVRRAWELATGDGDGGLGLDRDADLARRAAAALTPGGSAGLRLTDLAKAAGMPPRELTRWAVAWREGGAGGLAALREAWRPEPEAIDEARAALASLDGSGRVRVSGNRVMAGQVQLRLGRDGLWYRFERRTGGWDPSGPGQTDPTDLV